MSDRKELARYRANWQAEIDGAALYRTLAETESQPQLAEVYRRLAETEDKHATAWAEKMRNAGAAVPPAKFSTRARILMWLTRRFGPSFVLQTITGQEAADSKKYDNQPDARQERMHADEHSHAKILKTITSQHPGGIEGSAVARLEGRHKAVGGNARACRCARR